jgi:hypothetical protein
MKIRVLQSLMDQTFYGESHPYWASLSDVIVIKVILRVPMVELLY